MKFYTQLSPLIIFSFRCLMACYLNQKQATFLPTIALIKQSAYVLYHYETYYYCLNYNYLVWNDIKMWHCNLASSLKQEVYISNNILYSYISNNHKMYLFWLPNKPWLNMNIYNRTSKYIQCSFFILSYILKGTDDFCNMLDVTCNLVLIRTLLFAEKGWILQRYIEYELIKSKKLLNDTSNIAE